MPRVVRHTVWEEGDNGRDGKRLDPTRLWSFGRTDLSASWTGWPNSDHWHTSQQLGDKTSTVGCIPLAWSMFFFWLGERGNGHERHEDRKIVDNREERKKNKRE